MSITQKRASEFDQQQIIQKIYNEAGMICTEGWVTGLVGRRITPTIGTTNVADDTEIYTYSENGVILVVLHNVYTDGARTTVLYTERVQ